MNPGITGINSAGHSGYSGDCRNTDDGLPPEESAGSHASRSVSVLQNQDAQPSTQKPIGHEEHFDLFCSFEAAYDSYASRLVSVQHDQDARPSTHKPIGHEVHIDLSDSSDVEDYCVHNEPPLHFGCDPVEAAGLARLAQFHKAARVARWERIHHPSVHLKVDRYSISKIIGCLDFEKLLKGYIEIIPTISGSGFSANPLGGSDRRKVIMERGDMETIITFTSDETHIPRTKLHIGNDYWNYNDIRVLIEKYKSMNLM